MTRIGFAYNQKPAEFEPLAGETFFDERSLPADEAIVEQEKKARLATLTERAALDRYAEWDTVETIDAVAHALSLLGDVVRLDATDDFPIALREASPDIVFNMAEGSRGPNREAHVPAILEFYGIPYSGSDPFTLSLCLDKARTKEALAYHGVATPNFAVVRSLDQLDALRRHAMPVFVKPVHEGSSKGITEQSYCRTFEELETQVAHLLDAYAQPVLLETFLPGEEFTCAIIGNGKEAVPLPLVALRFDALPDGALPIFGFEAKWIWDTRETPLEIFECPARIDEGLRDAIERTALRAYQALGCRDWARIDLRLSDAGVPNVVDVNPLPGLLPDPAENSCLPLAARAAGVAYDEVILRCLIAAAERQSVSLPRAPTLARLPRRTPPRGVARW